MKKKILIPIMLVVLAVSALIITTISATGESKPKVFVDLDGNSIEYNPNKPFYYADPEGNYEFYDPGVDYIERNPEESAKQQAAEEKLKQEAIKSPTIIEESSEESTRSSIMEEKLQRAIRGGEYSIEVAKKAEEIINKFSDSKYELTKKELYTPPGREELNEIANAAVNAINSGKLAPSDATVLKVFIADNYSYLGLRETGPLYDKLVKVFESTTEEEKQIINDELRKLEGFLD